MRGVPTHGGRYVQYNLYGNLFEVSSKYVPPLRPVGRGAYGIVWLVLLSPFSFDQFISLQMGFFIFKLCYLMLFELIFCVM